MAIDTEHSPDPLIDEVRERRRKVFDACDNDIQKLYEAIQRLQAKHPEKIVREEESLSKRKARRG